MLAGRKAPCDHLCALVCRAMRSQVEMIFSNPAIAKEVTYHAEQVKAAREGFTVYTYIYQGEAFLKASSAPPFSESPRHLYWLLSTDGYQPYKDDAHYSCDPFVLTPLNFKPSLRYAGHVCGCLHAICMHGNGGRLFVATCSMLYRIAATVLCRPDGGLQMSACACM